MAKFRYSTMYPDRKTVFSPNPPKRHEKGTVYADYFYTSENEDSQEMFIYCVGHQVSWPEKNIERRVVSSSIIHYVVDGCGYFNGQKVHAGQFFFTLPYQEYSITQDPQHPMEYYWISFAGPNTRTLLKNCKFDELVSVQDFNFSDHAIRLFDEAIYEAHPENDIGLYLLGLCYQLLSFHKVMNLRHEKERALNSDYRYYKDAISYINENFNKGISASDVANHLHISTSYTRLIFNKYSKYSPNQMIIFKRFEQAQSDLEFSDQSIREVALRAGYHDQSLFARLFKKITGQSPVEYRESHRKKETKQP